MSGSTASRTRAGRIRLGARIALARHAADLLRSKEEALEHERVRLEGHDARSGDAWTAACATAAKTLLRARMLGASDELSVLVRRGPPEAATIRPHWQRSMGISYPGSVECEPGTPHELISTAALCPAADAYRTALVAAAEHAAARAAMRRLDRELATTRRRRRAIEDRLEPALERARRELDLHLDELDHDEGLRVRIAKQQEARPR